MNEIEKEKVVILPSFTDGSDVKIPIDMRYDLKENANKYYQKYHKMKRSQIVLKQQIENCKKEIDYFTQLEEQLMHCSIEDAMEIREELTQQKILKPKNIKKKKKNKPNILQLKYDNYEI